MKTPRYLELAYYLLLLLLSFTFVAFFCEVSSPFTFRYVGDSSIFMAMGKMFVDGKVPYLEFFDHKGPSLVLIESIGQMFAPYRSGVFVLEIINLFLSLIIVSKIGDLLLDRKRKIVLILAFLILFSRIVSKGNTSEEFSLIPLFLSLYIGCKYYFKDLKIKILDGFIVGLCFSFLFWLRLNNAGAIVAICIFLFIALILDKDFKSLKNLIFYFILGQIPFSILYMGYFLYHDAVYEMIYATFLFNFKYVSSFFSIDGEAVYVNIIVFVLLFVGTTFNFLKKKDPKIIIFSSLLFFFSYVTINIGYAYAHYFILMSPAFVFACLLVLDSIKGKKLSNFCFVIVIFLFASVTARSGYYVIKEGTFFKTDAERLKREIDEVISMIPAKDRERTYYYGVDANFYLWAEVNTNYKYFVLQEWHGRHDQDIFDEINEMMTSENYPLWIMSEFFMNKDHLGWSLNKKFAKFVDENYTLYTNTNGYLLFKRNQ